MRQTSKRARRSRGLMILIFMLLTALVLWGLAALLSRLFHYGANATVSAKDYEQLTPVEPSVVDETEEIPQNTYDPSCFYMDGGFLHYESDTVTSQIGIDVSAHQQEIDWQRVAESGIQFVILRVGYRGYTEGTIQEDAYFEQNLEGAISAGLDVGVRTAGLPRTIRPHGLRACSLACISSRRPSMSRRREKKHGLCWTGSPAISLRSRFSSTGRRSVPKRAATPWIWRR